MEELKRLKGTMQSEDFLRLPLFNFSTLLTTACANGHLEIVKYLISLGADVNEGSYKVNLNYFIFL